MTNTGARIYVKSVTFTIMLIAAVLVVLIGAAFAVVGATAPSSTVLHFEVHSIKVDLTTTSIGLVVMVCGCVLLLGLWLFGRRDVVPYHQQVTQVPLERRLLRVLAFPALCLVVVGLALLIVPHL